MGFVLSKIVALACARMGRTWAKLHKQAWGSLLVPRCTGCAQCQIVAKCFRVLARSATGFVPSKIVASILSTKTRAPVCESARGKRKALKVLACERAGRGGNGAHVQREHVERDLFLCQD
eukprot:2726038-Pleurochrysis_carterae.AAC.1